MQIVSRFGSEGGAGARVCSNASSAFPDTLLDTERQLTIHHQPKNTAMNKLDQLMSDANAYLPGKNDELALAYLTENVRHTFCHQIKALCHKIDRLPSHSIGSKSGGIHTVIHYTSIDVLVSMLERAAQGESAWLRLYDSVHLNDPDEGNYLARTLPPEHAWLAPRIGDCAYLSSFIFPENGGNMADDLVFWRGYGLEGQGCSLSLKVQTDKLRKVNYGRLGVVSAHEILEPALQSLAILKHKNLSRNVKCKLRYFLWDSLKEVSYLYKDQAYAYENECRFVLSDPPGSSGYDVHFEYETDRRKPPRIRHYCNDNALEIREILTSGSSITLGPCVPYREDVRFCIKALMEKANSLKSNTKLLAPDIKFSEISYRNF